MKKINTNIFYLIFNRSMFLSSNFIDMISEEILCDQGDTDVRSNSEIKSGESNPKFSDSFVYNCFAHSIKNILVRELSIGVRFHLLYLCLGIIEW